MAKTGKHHSTETRTRQNAAQKGWRHSEETLRKMRVAKRGERHPMYGKHHSIATLVKMSEAHKGKRHSIETLTKISTAQCGSNNSNWRGGLSFAPYPVDWNNSLREAIRKRDNYTCVLCGEFQNGRRHPVHHIDYDKQNLCSENLITLCTGCHRKTNFNREYWKSLFKTLYVPNFPKIRRKNESYC